eukprot:IDg23253t1
MKVYLCMVHAQWRDERGRCGGTLHAHTPILTSLRQVIGSARYVAKNQRHPKRNARQALLVGDSVCVKLEKRERSADYYSLRSTATRVTTARMGRHNELEIDARLIRSCRNGLQLSRQ